MNFIALMPSEIIDYVGESINIATVFHKGVMEDHLEIYRGVEHVGYD